MTYYILIETANDGTFFHDEGYVDTTIRRYFEIYRLSEEQQNNIISLLDEGNCIVQANNQSEALRKLSAQRGIIYKFADKDYYETVLPLEV
jgi:hypothetical protein